MKSAVAATSAPNDVAMRQRLAWLLPLGFLITATFILLSPQLDFVSQFGLRDVVKNYYDQTLYSRIVIFGNYFQHGFIRRGLAGSLTYISSENPLHRFVFFVTLSIVFLLLPLFLIVYRLAKSLSPVTASYLTAVLLMSPQTWTGWSHDLVRTDMLSAGFVAWSILAALSGYRWLAVSLVLCGLLVHEVAYIFGAPLLLAAFYENYRSGSLALQSAMKLMVFMVFGAAMIFALQIILSPSSEALAAGMLAAFPVPPHDELARSWRDIAIYMAVGNTHALTTAICHNFKLNSQYWIAVVFCMTVLTTYAFILPLWRRRLIVIVALWLPVLFMLIIANDTGRWLKLGVLNAWLITAFLMLRPQGGLTFTAHSQVIGALLLCTLQMLGYTPHHNVGHATESLTTWLGFVYDINLQQWLDTCDPRWRSIVYGQQ